MSASSTEPRRLLTLRRRDLLDDPVLLETVIPPSEEYLRRERSPLRTYVPDASVDRNQLAFHRALEPVILCFGGNNSGKSRAAAQDAFWTVLEEHPCRPNIRKPEVWIVSALYSTLRGGIYQHFLDFFPEWEIAEWGPQIDGWDMAKWIKVRKGGILRWWSAEGGAQSRKKFQAWNCDLIVADEEIDEAPMLELRQRLVTKGGRFIVAATLEESQPWVTTLESRAEEGDPDVFMVRLSSEAALRAGHISEKTYHAHSGRSLTPEQREVRVFGHSRKSQGLVYSDFDPRHHLVPSRVIDEPCSRYMAIDPGWDVTAVLWIAVFPDDTAEAYRELYLEKTNFIVTAERILRCEGWVPGEGELEGTLVPGPAAETIHRRLIDPSGFRKEPTGAKGYARRLEDMGVRPLRKADNDVLSGIDAVHSFLHIPAYQGRPKLVVQRHLRELLRERARYRYPKQTTSGPQPEPKPVKRDDHMMDVLRYLCACGLRYSPVPSEDARQAFEARHVLREELGIEPGLSAQELVRRELGRLRRHGRPA